MSTLTPCEVRLYQNPWPDTCPDGVLLAKLETAAHKLDDWLLTKSLDGYINADYAFACVILDPTRPRWQQTIVERVMAIVLLGDADKYIANAAAKADAHDRHWCNNRWLVDNANYCLGDGEFAYGNSAEHVNVADGASTSQLAIAGGSGLTQELDGEAAAQLLKWVLEPVHGVRQQFIREQRAAGNNLAWYSSTNQPVAPYNQVRLNRKYKVPASIE